MSGESIHVVARVTSLPGSVDAVRKILHDLLEPTRREQGCIRYELLENVSDPAEFVFVEEWTSNGTLDAHLASDGLRAAVAKLTGKLAQSPDIRRYQPPE